MSIVVAPTQTDIQIALRSFLLAILPTGMQVIEGQDNRVAEPAVTDFVVMTPIRRPRLETNIDTSTDAVFTGSIAGTEMTIAAVNYGALQVGSTIFGEGVTANTTVTAFGTGTGGAGTYTVSPAQTVGSETLAAGTTSLMQPTEIVIQLDVHGADLATASDNAQIISTMLRDDYAVSFFAALGSTITPLYADDPRQMPFINDQQQFETRWVVDVHLQADQAVTVPQQFAGALDIDVISVDATYPP